VQQTELIRVEFLAIQPRLERRTQRLPNKFGLPRPVGSDPRKATVNEIINLAGVLSAIAEHHDKGDRESAVAIFNKYAKRHLSARIISGKKGLLELKVVPLSLGSALLIQAAKALSGNNKFRKCLNCPEWMRIGAGSHSAPRVFCCDKCRVAFNRKMKREVAA
jgi:hypothetical protein